MSEMSLGEGLEVAKEFLPPRVRRGIYAAASILGYLLAAAVVGFAAAGEGVPSWLAVALAVLGALLGPIGQLAATNTTVSTPAVVVEVVDVDDSEGMAG